ncbi:hypothetical protein ALC57_01741 [Trachymyrmex cornetzi]|uniref:Uncharacterized protein n=1 Tax=Trachymyrmex cornetzi TaxID=471704 RepID=A0A195EKL0_9HYME|nr:hypothetical protein ALC57_01741 [Trachymyrmex cornetzi]
MTDAISVALPTGFFALHTRLYAFRSVFFFLNDVVWLGSSFDNGSFMRSTWTTESVFSALITTRSDLSSTHGYGPESIGRSRSRVEIDALCNRIDVASWHTA